MCTFAVVAQKIDQVTPDSHPWILHDTIKRTSGTFYKMAQKSSINDAVENSLYLIENLPEMAENRLTLSSDKTCSKLHSLIFTVSILNTMELTTVFI